MIWGSNPGGREIFCTCSDQPWGPPSLLYSGYWVSFWEVKQLGHGVNHQSPSSAEVKETVDLTPLLPLWAFMSCCRVNFTFFTFMNNCVLCDCKMFFLRFTACLRTNVHTSDCYLYSVIISFLYEHHKQQLEFS
jgi:hypothetical protein